MDTWDALGLSGQQFRLALKRFGILKAEGLRVSGRHPSGTKQMAPAHHLYGAENTTTTCATSDHRLNKHPSKVSKHTRQIRLNKGRKRRASRGKNQVGSTPLHPANGQVAHLPRQEVASLALSGGRTYNRLGLREDPGWSGWACAGRT